MQRALGGTMATSFVQTLRDETLRIEVGSPVVSGLAVENLELSTPRLSRAVRQSAIERRAVEPPGGMGGVPPTKAAGAATATVRMPGPNRLEMYEVVLPEAA